MKVWTKKNSMLIKNKFSSYIFVRNSMVKKVRLQKLITFYLAELSKIHWKKEIHIIFEFVNFITGKLWSHTSGFPLNFNRANPINQYTYICIGTYYIIHTTRHESVILSRLAGNENASRTSDNYERSNILADINQTKGSHISSPSLAYVGRGELRKGEKCEWRGALKR